MQNTSHTLKLSCLSAIFPVTQLCPRRRSTLTRRYPGQRSACLRAVRFRFMLYQSQFRPSILSFLYSIDSALSGTGSSQQIKQQTNMFSQKISGLGLFLLISFCENFTFRFQTHQNKIKTDLDPYFKKWHESAILIQTPVGVICKDTCDKPLTTGLTNLYCKRQTLKGDKPH